MTEIECLWTEHRAASFPQDAAGVEVDGVNLVEIDTFAAGCISSFLGNAGTLDTDRVKILKECVSDIGRVCSQMNAETSKYFVRLHKLGQLVLNELHVR